MAVSDTLSRIDRFRDEHTYQEVVVHDGYRLKTLKCIPDTIYDIGASCGIFTVWAKHLFPDATVIAVEPDDENFTLLSEVTADMPGVVRVQAAIGTSPMFVIRGTSRGGYRFRSAAMGFPPETLARLQQVDVEAVTLAEILDHYQDGGGPSLVKIDIEASEGALLSDSASTEMLRSIDYITIELHFWAARHELIEPTAAAIMAWIGQFRHTHVIELWASRSGGMAWMTRRSVNH